MKIKPSTYIRNEYGELSSYCRETAEPVYITKNGEGDLVVMGIDAYDQMRSKLKDLEERCYYLGKALEAADYNAKHPETYTMEEVFEELRGRRDEREKDK